MTVRYDVASETATVTLDSPHNRNALSAGLVGQLRRRLADAAADPGVRAVLLTHTGGTFCAGADLGEASTAGAEPDASALAGQRSRSLIGLLRALVELPKPVLGLVDGHVRAGGMGLVGACDIVVAGPKSTFAFTESRLGLAPAVISLTVLPRLTSRAAARYFLTGETFGAADAERMGLVTIAADDPAASAGALLAELRACSPQGLAESKALAAAAILAGFDESAERLAAQSARLFCSPEARGRMAAFLQKRPPQGRR